MNINVLRLCFPIPEEKWLAQTVDGTPTIATTARDVARAIDGALKFKAGFQAFTISGDYEQKIMNMSKAKRLLGWEPLARPHSQTRLICRGARQCAHRKGEIVPFNVKRRGKLTYYYEGDDPVLSSLVVETQPDGDLRICFSGLTGGYSATGVLGLDTVAHMEPEIEIPLVFRCWESWLQQAGICDSIAEVDFIEIHAFGCQPKSPNPLVDPVGYAKEIERLRTGLCESLSQVISRNTAPTMAFRRASPSTSSMCRIRRRPTSFMALVSFRNRSTLRKKPIPL